MLSGEIKIMVKNRTRVISVRLPEPIYNLITQLSMQMSSDYKTSPSNLVRMMIEYFLMSYTLGEYKKPMVQIRKEFITYLKSITKKRKIDLISNNQKEKNEKKNY